MTIREKYDRRRFLKRLGAGTALLPFLDLEIAEVRGATPPKRFVALAWPNGVTRDWWPSGGERDFKLGAGMSPLEPHRDDIVVLDSLTLKSFQDEHPGHGGHTALPYLLTGGQAAGGSDSYVGGKISLDQHVANAWQKREPTAFPSLVLGVDNKEETKPNHKYISFTGPAVGGSPAAPPVQTIRTSCSRSCSPARRRASPPSRPTRSPASAPSARACSTI